MPLLKKSCFCLLLPLIAALAWGCVALPPRNPSPESSIRPSGGQEEPVAAVTTYEVKPQTTDKAIDNWLEPHGVAIDRSVPPRQQLFLFFSGSNGEPSRQQLIVGSAARLGFPAINLRYPNAWSVARLCGRSPDRDCHEKVRLEILDGVDRSPEIKVSPANSIENRLVKLLRYLDNQHPGEGWSRYLDGNHPRWANLIVAGHSQGGGQAAIIAKQHRVERAILLAAPADFNRESRRLAPWIAKSGATSPDRYYGFVHTRDPGFRRILQAWLALGMAKSGSPVNVDNTRPPYQRSQQLTTSAPPAQSGKYHGSVATDSTTPKSTDGLPLFVDVWTYLITGN